MKIIGRAGLFILLIGLFFGVAESSPANAQSGSGTGGAEKAHDAANLTASQIDAMVARLSDQEVRNLLLERLKANEAAADDGVEDPAMLITRLTATITTIRTNLEALVGSAGSVPQELGEGWAAFRDGRPASTMLYIAVATAFGFALAFGAERLFLRQHGHRLAPPDGADRSGALAGLCIRALVRLVGVAIFALMFFAVFVALYQGHEPTRVVILGYLAAVLIMKISGIVSDFLLSPDAPRWRMVKMDDQGARFLHSRFSLAAAVIAFGIVTCAILSLFATPSPAHSLMSKLVSLVFVIILCVSFIQARRSISESLQVEGSHPVRAALASAWPMLLSLLVAILWLIIQAIYLSGGEVSYLASFGTLFIIMLLPHVDAEILRIVRHRVADQGDSVMAIIIRTMRVVVPILAILFISRVWDVDVGGMASNSIGDRVTGALSDIALTALVAYILWQIVKVAIDKRLQEEQAEKEEVETGEVGGQGASRIATLLPLIRTTAQVTIAVMAIMLSLSALGVNIGPLLAGAGVIGLAVGFGAQTFVRDVVSGIFFLVDDAFRKGEYIDVGSAKGTVEKISVRSVRLRHHRGALHTVPFGEIAQLTNFSRDWVIVKMMFRVPFDTDVERVRKIFKQIGQEMLKDPEIGDDFLDPFKSQGVFDVDDSAIIIRAKFMAKPGRQFLIRRVAYIAVQRAFAENGIEFAPKQVIVRQADEKPHKVGPEALAAAAGAGALSTGALGNDPDDSPDGDDEIAAQ